MVLHSVTLWTGAWENGSGWGLGVPNYFFNILIPLMVLQNGTFEWHFVTHSRSFCVTRPKTYLLWFWLPPFLSSVPLNHTLTATCLKPCPLKNLRGHVTGDFTVAFGHGHPLVMMKANQYKHGIIQTFTLG